MVIQIILMLDFKNLGLSNNVTTFTILVSFPIPIPCSTVSIHLVGGRFNVPRLGTLPVLRLKSILVGIIYPIVATYRYSIPWLQVHHINIHNTLGETLIFLSKHIHQSWPNDTVYLRAWSAVLLCDTCYGAYCIIPVSYGIPCWHFSTLRFKSKWKKQDNWRLLSISPYYPILQFWQ